ncbi:MAG: hypothetical protein R3F49_03925 [Planctomycetota bacterium]
MTAPAPVLSAVLSAFRGALCGAVVLGSGLVSARPVSAAPSAGMPPASPLAWPLHAPVEWGAPGHDAAPAAASLGLAARAPIGRAPVAGSRQRSFSRGVPAFGLAVRLALRAAGEEDLRGGGAGLATDGALGLTPRPALAPNGDEQDAAAARSLAPAYVSALAEDIAAAMAELAGAQVVPELTVRLVPRTTVEARARLEVDRAFPLARRSLDEAVAKALGMLPADADLGELLWRLLADDVGGVRDSVEDEILLADDITLNLARLVLAHEFAQRASEAPEASPTATTDERLASDAVREARNMLLVAAWVRQNLGPEDVQAMVSAEARRTRATEPLPPFVWKPILGLYTQGQAFLARQARIGPFGAAPRAADVSAALAAPPRTTEELLHPGRYWEPLEREPSTPVTFEIGALPEGWTVVHEDTLGELVLALFLTPPEQRRGLATSPLGIAQIRFTNAAAEGWDGDRVLLARREGAWYVRLVTRWEDADEAREFAAAARAVDAALGLGLQIDEDLALPEAVAEGLLVDVSCAVGASADERRALAAALTVRTPAHG